MPSRSSIYDPEIFAAPPSFMGVRFSHELSKSKAAILGIPFDCGYHPVRIGSRLGPNAIREQSALVRPYEPPDQDFNPLERLGLVDCGNVRVVPGNVDISYPVIEEAVSAGRHTIRVERAGFKTKTETIDVPANTTVRRTYVLEQEGSE